MSELASLGDRLNRERSQREPSNPQPDIAGGGAAQHEPDILAAGPSTASDTTSATGVNSEVALEASSRKLEHLLAHHGAFFTGHRAEADVWALFQLLQLPARAVTSADERAGQTYLQLLLQSSDAGAVRVRADRAPYSAKDWLKQRGYRWDADRKVWWKDILMDDYLSEKAAFAAASLPEPTGTMLDAVNRHRF